MIPTDRFDAITSAAPDLALLLILALACWRMAHFLVRDSGPFRVMSRIRRITKLGGLLSCKVCASVWTAALAWLLWESGSVVGRGIVMTAAVSGGALMIATYSGVNHDHP